MLRMRFYLTRSQLSWGVRRHPKHYCGGHVRIPRSRRAYYIGAAILFAAGCKGSPKADAIPPAAPNPPGEACTLIGCRDQLIVEVVPRPARAFRVVATDSAGSTQEAQCGNAAACATSPGEADTARVALEMTTGAVSIRVTDAARRSITVKVVPRYEELYPNGRRCGPVCRAARVQVRWPH